jgi:hypothetical protein
MATTNALSATTAPAVRKLPIAAGSFIARAEVVIADSRCISATVVDMISSLLAQGPGVAGILVAGLDVVSVAGRCDTRVTRGQ